MSTTDTQTRIHPQDADALAAASEDDLHGEIIQRLGKLFPQRPTVVAVCRLGLWDGAWRSDSRSYSDAYELVNINDGVDIDPVDDFVRLVKAYAAHPEADQDLIRRDKRFPEAFELYVG